LRSFGFHVARPVVVTLACLAALVVPSQELLAAGASSHAGLSPNPSSTENDLSGVAALSSTDAWAVGEYEDDSTHAEETLVLHWNGSTWLQVPSPNPSSTNNNLTAVRAITASSVWAVGYYTNDSTGAIDTLVLHWNGTTWSHVPSPNPSSFANSLSGVSGGGTAGGIWAVGDREPPSSSGDHRTLILHWTGSKMVVVASPNPKSNDNLRDVRAPSTTNAWAVGSAGGQTLILHWNGSSWSRVSSPNPFDGNRLIGTNGSPTNEWAVGAGANSGGSDRTLALHRNGNTWVHVTTPNEGSLINELQSVRAFSSSNVWAVGDFLDNEIYQFVWKGLILHWNGTKWSRITSPNPSSSDNRLTDVAGPAVDDVWAVGEYHDDVSGATETLILHWNGSTWTQS
jgi:hypothetical protein